MLTREISEFSKPRWSNNDKQLSGNYNLAHADLMKTLKNDEHVFEFVFAFKTDMWQLSFLLSAGKLNCEFLYEIGSVFNRRMQFPKL